MTVAKALAWRAEARTVVGYQSFQPDPPDHEWLSTDCLFPHGTAFDKAYVDHEVAYHQQVIDALDKILIPGATNAELKALRCTGQRQIGGRESIWSSAWTSAA